MQKVKKETAILKLYKQASSLNVDLLKIFKKFLLPSLVLLRLQIITSDDKLEK